MIICLSKYKLTTLAIFLFAVLCSCKGKVEKPILIDGLAGDYFDGRNRVRVVILSAKENRLEISNVEFSNFLDSAIELTITDKLINDFQTKWIDSQSEDAIFYQSVDSGSILMISVPHKNFVGERM